MGHPGLPQFSFKTLKRHTYDSLVNLTALPSEVQGSKVQGSTIKIITVKIKDAEGNFYRRRFPKLPSSSMRGTCPKTLPAMPTEKSIFSRALTRICVMRRSLALSPKAQRLLAL